MILVRPRLSLERTVESSLLVGAAVGLTFSLIFFAPLVQNGMVNWGGLLRISLIGIFGPLSLSLVVLSCLSQRKILVVASGYAFCFAAVFVALIRFVAVLGASDDLSLGALLALCLTSLVIALLGGSIGIAVLAMMRTVGVVVLEQDGTLCPNCGYKLVPRDVVRCSECGQDPQLPRGRARRLSRFLYGHARLILIVVLVISGTATVHHLVTVIGPLTRFHDQFESSEFGVTFSRMASDDYYQDGITWPAEGFTQELSDDPTRAIVVLYAPGASRSQPIMQIRMHWAQKPKAGFPTATFDGVPAVMTNLNREQAEFVIERGSVPQTLIDALLEAATEVGWTATPPTPVPFGQMTQSYTRKGPARPVIIVADSHFPAEQREKNAASAD